MQIREPLNKPLNLDAVLRHHIAELPAAKFLHCPDISRVLHRSQVLPLRQHRQVLLTLLKLIPLKIRVLHHELIDILLIEPVLQLPVLLIKNAHNAPVPVRIVRVQITHLGNLSRCLCVRDQSFRSLLIIALNISKASLEINTLHVTPQ